ncbi:hypothetical protein AB1Y20_021250 [Prymnesium parvum]|uniref:CHK kinase-like domain-containing protein n=1 Tax=Prymnesium parvum TaxID=97485 RepID=A0AB34JJL3_PRYPA
MLSALLVSTSNYVQRVSACAHPRSCHRPVMSELLRAVDDSRITTEQLTAALRVLGQCDTAEVVAVDVVSENRYPGSLSGVLRLSLSDHSVPRRIFVKKVTPQYVGRPWPATRRTLAYARTESRFYQEFATDDRVVGDFERLRVSLPRLAISDCNLEVLLGNEPVHADAGPEPSGELQSRCGSLLLLEAAVGYSQTSPLSEPQAIQALQAVAGLHAVFWERADILQAASCRLQRHGGCFALEIREPEEVSQVQSNWEKFAQSFRDVDESLCMESFDLGARLQQASTWVSAQMSPDPADAFVTLIHGDFKAMNVMLPSDGAPNPTHPMLIDFASCGVGYGMSDVAMLLTHSVAPSTLENGGLNRLIDAYLEALAQREVRNYSKETCHWHFHLATVDYARFVVSRFWGDASVESFSKRAHNPNVCLPNRNVEAAIYFAKRLEKSLSLVEQSMGAPCK